MASARLQMCIGELMRRAEALRKVIQMGISRRVFPLVLIALLLGWAPSFGDTVEPTEVRISVDCARQMGTLDHFWRSTAFGEAGDAIGSATRQALAYVGSVPHGGIAYVRALNVLDQIRVTDFETASPGYDWSDFDKLLDIFLAHELRPFLAFDGTPKGVEKSKEPGSFQSLTPEQWRRLARDVASHCIERYGRDEVRKWYFEGWNEPEFMREGLWNHYDACSAGLREADSNLRFGGPATYRTLAETFAGFLAHCDTGTNLFSGDKGVPLDFISVHEKGVKRSGAITDSSPVIKEWIDREIATIKYIRTNHPRFAKALYVNNECDPKGGFFQNYLWLAGPYHPAVMSKYIDHHLRRIVDGLGAKTMIVCHNVLLGGWGNRSHTVRFGSDKQFEVIKKPTLNAYVLWSLLGDTRCAIQGPDLFSDVGAIATRTGDGQVAILVYNCNEVATREKADDAKWVLEEYGTARIKLDLTGLPFGRAVLAHYRIDKQHTNPYGLWEAMGSPEQPTAEQLAKMRADQEVALLEQPREVRTVGGKLQLDFDLPKPGVSLLLLSAKPPNGPGKVAGLRGERFQGREGQEAIMLSWKGLDSRFVRSYEVLYSESPAGAYERVNARDLLCTAFLHVKSKPGSAGYYKVRAVDYWGRAGEDSDVLRSPE